MTNQQYFFANIEYGAYDIIYALHELHSRGFQQLRLTPGMSANGMCWRWHLYPNCLLRADKKAEHHEEPPICSAVYGTTGILDSRFKPKQMADMLLEGYGELLCLGFGDDSAYAQWFENKILPATQKNEYPIAYGEYCDCHEGWICGDFIGFPPFTPTDIYKQSDDYIVNYAKYAMGKHSANAVEDVLNRGLPHPNNHELARTIKYAIQNHIGLLSILVEGHMQALRYGDDIVEQHLLGNATIITFKDNTKMTLYDYMDLIPWKPINK